MMMQNARINSQKLKPLHVLEQIYHALMSLWLIKENTGITSSTYACFHHVIRLINYSQANDDNITRGSSSHPLPFEPKQPLHVGQLNHILFMPQLSAVPILVSFLLETSQLCCFAKEVIIIV
jgi:hypothetical protein